VWVARARVADGFADGYMRMTIYVCQRGGCSRAEIAAAVGLLLACSGVLAWRSA